MFQNKSVAALRRFFLFDSLKSVVICGGYKTKNWKESPGDTIRHPSLNTVQLLIFVIYICFKTCALFRIRHHSVCLDERLFKGLLSKMALKFHTRNSHTNLNYSAKVSINFYIIYNRCVFFCKSSVFLHFTFFLPRILDYRNTTGQKIYIDYSYRRS